MPPKQSSKPVQALRGYKHLLKKAKQPISVEAKAVSLFRSLHDQLDSGYVEKAVRTCLKILRLDLQSTLARQTLVQCLLHLEKYPVALGFLQSLDLTTIETAYCLTKVGREAEAKEEVGKVEEEDVVDERGRLLLEAQMAYRFGDYVSSKNIYQDLLLTADEDSPEYVDISSNLSACQVHLSFLSSIPSLISQSNRRTDIEAIESTQLAPIIAAVPEFAPHRPTPPLSSVPPALAQPATVTKGPGADPERWLPLRQRSYYQPVQVTKKKKKDKIKEKLMTQGSAADDAPSVGVKKGGKGKKGK